MGMTAAAADGGNLVHACIIRGKTIRSRENDTAGGYGIAVALHRYLGWTARYHRCSSFVDEAERPPKQIN